MVDFGDGGYADSLSSLFGPPLLSCRGGVSGWVVGECEGDKWQATSAQSAQLMYSTDSALYSTALYRKPLLYVGPFPPLPGALPSPPRQQPNRDTTPLGGPRSKSPSQEQRSLGGGGGG